MSVTLTAEQFASLLDKPSTKKITKKDLEKQRPNAMNIDEFINNFKYSKVTKLLTMELPDFMVFSILENINSIETEDLPFYCSNHQTKSFYYKQANNEWVKGTEFMTKLYNKIFKNAIQEVMSKFNSTINDDEDEKYEKSIDSEKQRILCSLCNCEKYPFNKCVEKVLIKLGKALKE
jgi:hypothetical protein